MHLSFRVDSPIAQNGLIISRMKRSQIIHNRNLQIRHRDFQNAHEYKHPPAAINKTASDHNSLTIRFIMDNGHATLAQTRIRNPLY